MVKLNRIIIKKELNLTAAYPITESLATSILYGDVNEDATNDV